MPYSKLVTEEFLRRLENAVSEQHLVVDELRRMQRSNKILKWLVAGLAVVTLLLGVLAITGYRTGERVSEQAEKTQTLTNKVRLDTCQSHNSSLRALRASQLEASLGTIDALVASVNAQSGPTPERTATAEDVKNRLRAAAADKEAHPAVPDQDCDGDGMPGGTDADDYVQ